MKIDGWDTVLINALQEASNTPFEWGKHDCVCFPMGIVSMITGIDHMDGWRGKYKTAKGAKRIEMRGTKGRGLEAMADDLFEKLPTHLLAQRGDLVIADLDMGPTFGVCAGRRCAFVGPDGLIFLPLARIRAAWRV